jgi:hypothetical protein
MIRFTIIIGLLAGCGGKSEESPPAAASGSAPAGSGSAPAAGSAAVKPLAGSAAGSGSGSAVAAAPVDPELPTTEDFEEESTNRITEKNVDTEVKAIEKEIGDN